MTTDKRLAIIRGDKKCAVSLWADCSDEHIIEMLEANNCKTVKEALEYALAFVVFDEAMKREHPNF